MPSRYSSTVDMLLERVADADVAGRAIDRGHAEPARQERRLRPEGRAGDAPRSGRTERTAACRSRTGGRSAVDLGRRAAEPMVAAGRIGEATARYPGRLTAPRTAASSSAAAASRSSPGRSLRIRLMRALPGTAMKPPPSMPVTSRKERPTSGCAGARLERRRMRPQRRKHGVRGLERVDAQLGHAEIGGAAGDRDVGDEEAHLRGDRRRAWSARHRRRSRAAAASPASNSAAQRLHAGADAGARLAALLVADEGEERRRRPA